MSVMVLYSDFLSVIQCSCSREFGQKIGFSFAKSSFTKNSFIEWLVGLLVNRSIMMSGRLEQVLELS